MSGFTINILKEPHEPTDFKRGEIVGLGDQAAIVVGEDDMYLHTFLTSGEGNGMYHGIRKVEANLASVKRNAAPTPEVDELRKAAEEAVRFMIDYCERDDLSVIKNLRAALEKK